MDFPTDDAFSKESNSSVSIIDDAVPIHISLPARSAGPEEVRSYLTQLLLKRGCTLDLAQETASKWTTATGKKLRQSELRIYRGIFGLDGLTIYEEVQTACIRAHNEQVGVWTRRKTIFWSIPAFGVVLTVTGAVLIGFIHKQSDLLVVSVVFMCIGLGLAFYGGIGAYGEHEEIDEERGLQLVLEENYDPMNGARGTIQ